MNLTGRRSMSKRNTSKILIIVPHGVRIQFIRKKKSINGNRMQLNPSSKKLFPLESGELPNENSHHQEYGL